MATPKSDKLLTKVRTASTIQIKSRAKNHLTYSALPEANQNLYRAVRAALLLQGDSFTAWCQRAGIDRAYAVKAVVGKTNGQRAVQLRAKLVAAAGLQ